MNPNAFDANSIMANVSAQQQAAPPTAPAHSGNWFTHLLPTGGAVGGGLSGAALGASVGSVVPIIGTGIGGILGGILGATVGGGGAKAAENGVEGKSIGDGVGAAAIEGGIGQAAGGIVGKVLGKGAEFLGNRATNMATNKAARVAAEDGIETAANTYKDVSPELQKLYNAKDSLSHVQKMGYDVAPDNLVHVGNTSNDILNEILNKALADSGPVDLAHYPQIIKDALAQEGGTLGSFDKVGLARGRMGFSNTPSSKLLQKLENLGAGVAKTNSDPNELRTLTTQLGRLVQDAKPTITQATGAIDPTQRSIYNVLNNVRGQVKSSIYDRPEINDLLKAQVGSIAPDEAMKITPELAQHLSDVITKSGHSNGTAAQDLLSEISRNINVGNLGQEGQKVGQIVTSKGGQARAASEAGLGNEGLDTHPLLETAGAINPIHGVVGNAVNLVAHAKDNPAVLSTLSRIGALGSKLAPAAGTAAATSPNLAADPVAGGTIGGIMNGQQTQQLQQGGNDQSKFLDAARVLSILDPTHYGGMGQSVLDMTPQLQKNQMLNSEIGSMGAGYANAGGAQGLGGLLSQITSHIPGTAAHTYEAQKQATAQQLAQTMGISPEAATALLPHLMQNGASSGISQGILGNLQGQLAY